MKNKLYIIMSLLFFIFLIVNPVRSETINEDTTNGQPPIKTIIASRVNSDSPKIDGKLDDPCWKKARVYCDFGQQTPNEGAEPTESTCISVIYDDQAIFVGVQAFDSDPTEITGQMRRRDEMQGFLDDDEIMVTLDPYHDHQNGNVFMVNPKGCPIDCIIHKDIEYDFSWDGIWEVVTSIDSSCWIAEFRIPFSIMRFPKTKNLVLGLNVDRYIARKKESDQWQLMPKVGAGNISRLGHLEGLKDVLLNNNTKLELSPFLLTKSTFEPKNSVTNPDGRKPLYNAGLDIKYHIRPDVILNATINPDFGQVEADPAILNLTAYETFYPEKRPFFVEGSAIFDTPFQLFYSRRIGKNPGTFPIPSDWQIHSYPEYTTVWGASKITSKIGRTTFGFIEAVTAEEYAKIDSAGISKKQLVEPLTNFVVGRINQDIWQGNSTVGMMFTAVNRHSTKPAYSSGIDWNLKFMQNAYSFSGQLAGSSSGAQDSLENGYGVKLDFGKETGKYFRAKIGFETVSPKFNINDAGYLLRNDLVSVNPSIQLRRLDQPWSIIRSVQTNLSSKFAWNYKGNNLVKNIQLSNNLTFLNYYYAFIGVSHSFPSLDDRITRGGPLLKNPTSTNIWCGLTSDTRKKVYTSSTFSSSWSKSGNWTRNYNLAWYFKPSSNITMDLSGGYTSLLNKAQWITNMDVNGDNRNESIFGELKEKVLDLGIRSDIAFTPTLSFQLYMQPFIAVIDYKGFKVLSKPASYEFAPINLGIDPDYKWKALRSNCVLRWEYSPGSVIFFVWSREHNDESITADFSPLRDLSSVFDGSSKNIFMVKLNYLFDF